MHLIISVRYSVKSDKRRVASAAAGGHCEYGRLGRNVHRVPCGNALEWPSCCLCITSLWRSEFTDYRIYISGPPGCSKPQGTMNNQISADKINGGTF